MVQEAIVVIRDIFRKYPNKYENIISILCENLDSLDEPEARFVYKAVCVGGGGGVVTWGVAGWGVVTGGVVGGLSQGVGCVLPLLLLLCVCVCVCVCVCGEL